MAVASSRDDGQDAPERVRSVTAIGVPAVAFGSRIETLRVLARPGLGPLMLRMPMPPPAGAQPAPIGDYQDSEADDRAQFLEDEKHLHGGGTDLDDGLLEPRDAIDKPAVFVGKGIPEVVRPGAEQE